MKKICFIIILILQIVICFSQNNMNMPVSKTNSQISISNSTYYKPSLINRYIDSADACLISDPQKAIKITEDALEMSIKSEYKKGEMNSYRILGSINYYYGKNDIAATYFKKVLNYMNTSSDYKSFYDVYKLMGLVYKSMDSTKKSEYYFNKFLTEAKKDNNKVKEIEANNNIASLYLKNKQYDQAINYSQNSLDNSNSINSNPNQEQAISNNIVASNYILGEAYYKKGDKNKATKHFNSSIENSTNSNITTNEFQQNVDVVDNISFNNTVSQQTKIKDNNSNVSNELNYEIGNLYLKNNDNKEAIQYFEKSTQSKGNSESEQNIQKNYKSLSLAYEKAGNIEKALKTYKLYVKSLDSAIAQKNTSTEIKAQLNSMLENTAKKVKLLEDEKSLNNKTINFLKDEQQLQKDKNSTKNILIYILLIVIVMMFVAGYYIVKAVKQKRRANHLLELKSLRNQINPHFVFNALNSVNQFNSMNDELAANRFLTDFSSLMRSIMQAAEADFISFEEELNILRLYLKLEHDRFADKFEYSFSIDENIEKENIYIPPMLIQPFIENAIWHGLRYLDIKGLLKIDIFLKDKNIYVTIKDNGIGRIKSKDLKTDNQKKYNSTGIANIKKRIFIIEKCFRFPIKIDICDLNSLENEEHTGTLVNIIFPIKNIKNA